MVVDKHILVVDVIARQEQTHGRCEAQSAIAPVG